MNIITSGMAAKISLIYKTLKYRRIAQTRLNKKKASIAGSFFEIKVG